MTVGVVELGVGVSSSQEQTLSGTGTRVYTAHGLAGRDDGYQWGVLVRLYGYMIWENYKGLRQMDFKIRQLRGSTSTKNFTEIVPRNPSVGGRG